MTEHDGPWSRLPPKAAPPPAPRRRLDLKLWLVFMLGIGLLLYGLTRLFPGALSSRDEAAEAARMALLLTLVASGLLSARYRWKQVMRDLAIWICIGGVVLVGYTFKDDIAPLFNRMRSAAVPSYPVAASPGELMISRDANGSYYVMAQVNGQPLQFLVDTGASEVVLSPADAQRLGVDLKALSFGDPVETANGEGRGAPYRAQSLTVGPIQLSDVPMSINQAPMRHSLLGMTFFNRLQAFRFEGGRLYLKAKP
jgi:aspartyl protease family protein